jgi:tetratricopeptide (TPR) repeat protein
MRIAACSASSVTWKLILAIAPNSRSHSTGNLVNRDMNSSIPGRQKESAKILYSPRTTALDLLLNLEKNLTRRMPVKTSVKGKKLTRKEVRDLDIKITFMEGIVRRDPKYVEALQILGDHYTQRGEFGYSLKVDKRLSRLEPRNPLVFYNLACSYSLNSDFDLAASALERALSLGYNDFKWLARDPDLRQLRKHPLYRTIEDKIRKMKVKVS